MPIQTECEHCGFTYVSPDEMAGKKVRCRNCGQVFSIPGSTAQPEQPTEFSEQFADIPQLDESFDMPGRRDSDETRQMPAVTMSESNMTGGVGSAKSRMERGEDPGLFDIAGQPGALTRPSQPFSFPYAADLDDWLPRLVPLLVLFWFFYTFWGWVPDPEARESHPSWAGLLPIGLLLITLLALWTPLFAGAMRKVAQATNFSLPDRTIIRALCLASLPFGFGGVFWLAGESPVTLGIGLLLGAVMAVPAAWFLYRLRETEIAHAAIAIAFATTLSALITVGLVWGGNLALNKSLNATSNAHLFTASPLGPNLEWELPAGEPTTPPVRQATTQTKPATMAIGPGDTPIRPALVTPTPDDTTPLPLPAQVPAGEQPGQTPPVALIPPVVAPEVIPDADPFANHPVFGRGRYLAIKQPILEVIYPATQSKFFAAVTPSTDVDTHDVWLYSIDPLAAKARAPLASSVARSGYALSPDGKFLARVTRFGDSSVIQVWDFTLGRIVNSYQLRGLNDEPRLVGFLDNERLLCEWRGTGMPGSFAYEVSALNVISMQLTAYATSDERHSEVSAIMPEGSVAAVGAAAADNSLSLRFWLPGKQTDKWNRPSRVWLMQFPGVFALTPTGIAPRPDGAQIAIAYQDGLQLQIMVCSKEPRKGLLQNHIFPGGIGLRPLPRTGGATNHLTWLPGGDLLIYDQLVIDATAGGKPLAIMDAGVIMAQKLVNDSTMHFVVSGPRGLRVLEAQIKPNAR